ncbi:MAG: HEPN domain-containing protein [Candidatus Eremiobacteraeota bacterium]|nr:HEPN domain-containing protein [Candidatus Eremiobacteraeota bacterium]
MSINVNEIINIRLEKAEETLNAAMELSNKGHTTSVINRVYYACFYAVNALILTGGYSSSKHSGVRSLFNQHFVRTGLVDGKWGRFYSDLYTKRQKGDYEDLVKFTTREEDEILEKAKIFIAEIKKITLNHIGKI